MKEWFSAKELAGLPGVPGTVQGVNSLAARENWQFRQREGRGGGREYHLSYLPAVTRDHLTRSTIKTTQTGAAEAGRLAAKKLQLTEDMAAKAEHLRREQALAGSMSLTGKAAERDTAKHLILSAYNTYCLHKSGKKSVAVEFCVAYNRGEIEVDSDVRALIPSLSYPTLCRMIKAVKSGEHLGGKYGHRRGQTLIDTQPELRKYILALMADKPNASYKLIYEGVRAHFRNHPDIKIPSLRRLEIWCGAWKEHQAEIYTSVTNPDAWKSKWMVAAGSLSADAPHVNAKWEIDSTKADLLLTDGRYNLLCLIDVYSRRAKFLVAKVSKATAIGLLIRRAILDWGVPEKIKADNGQDYRSKHIARVCSNLGIQQDFSDYFSPWQKGHVERVIGTFNHGLSELLPGFIGHDVAERQAIEARKAFSDRLFKKDGTVEIRMSAAEFQEFADRWTDTIYHHTPHGGLNDKTPFEVAQACREPIRWIDNERVLDLLLAEAPGDGWRTVTKKGIRIDNDLYIAPELERYINQRVQTPYDPFDLGRIYVYAHDRPEDPLDPNATKPGLHFVCVAECPARLGISREEHAAKAAEIRERQKQRVQEEKRKLKQLSRKIGTDSVVDEILEHKRQQAAAKLVQFPKKKIEHRTAGIEAAKQAIAMMRDPSDRELTVAEVEDMQARTQAAPTTVRPMFESMFQRALWTAEVMMGDRQAELSGDDHEFMRELRRLNPATYRSAEDILNLKYEDRWDQYSAFRRAVGWPEARRPKG